MRNPLIRRKLLTIILLTSGIVLLLNCVALFGYQYLTYRRSAARNLMTLGSVVASNSTAAVAFDNVGDANTVLAALKAEPQIVAAGLYRADGSLFAKYPKELPDRKLPAALGADGERFVDGNLVSFRPVAEGHNSRLGTLYLCSDLHNMHAAFAFYGAVVGVVALISLLLAYVISNRLQRQISLPILDLAGVAAAVSKQGDYSVRASKKTDDEIGLLTETFNHMLSRIQRQLGNLDLLRQITRAIAERQDMQSIFKVVLGSLEDSMPIDYGCILLYDPIAESLTVAGVGVRSDALQGMSSVREKATVPIDQNGLSSCVRGALVYEPDISNVDFPFPRLLMQAGLRSLVLAPLLVESTIFGVLVAARKTAQSFTSGDCEFLKQLSEHVALASHQSQLHGALQQAYDDLRQSQHTVMQQERLRALGQMASGIAHDINNAISPVALYTESLLEREPNLSERARNYLTTIRRAIEDVAETVARMREFYRVREPQLTLTTVDLNRVVEEVIELTRARWSDVPQQSGIVVELQKDLAEGLPKIMGAESEIRDALTNLIFNSVDAMPEGGTLTLRTRIVSGHGMSDGSATTVAVEVADTGVGMDEQTRRQCLEPFFTTKGERGTGLGLAMVYGMAQRHSAGLEIDSQLGEGTTMRLIFIAAVPLFVDTARFPAAPTSGRRLRILIIDDDPMLIKSVRDILEADGHVVTSADGGENGIRAFVDAERRAAAFDIVITDLGMPYVDGRKVAAAVKAQSAATPVVMLTGWGQRLVSENDVPAHVDRVLSKPPRLHELRTALVELTHGGHRGAVSQ